MVQFRINNKYNVLTNLRASSSVFLRFALGFSFLSAVADRFGLWGAFGEPHVAWGTFARFVAYTGTLNWFLPRAAVPTLAIVATCAETLFGILLVLGWQTRTTAFLSGLLLLLFAATMTAGTGYQGAAGLLSVFGSRRSLPFWAIAPNIHSA
jgi:uncharacterized membrane protein YphA (DoxX/SURF4 family)